MIIRFAKQYDGECVVSCQRADGSVVWQKQKGDFFPLHDLTHYVVETTLSFSCAFYGLIAQGWSFEDFSLPGSSRKLPAEAGIVECLVGLLDVERYSRRTFSCSEINESLCQMFEEGTVSERQSLSPKELEIIRHRVRSFIAQWQELKSHCNLEFIFPDTFAAASP